jgi:hypothetical protein
MQIFSCLHGGIGPIVESEVIAKIDLDRSLTDFPEIRINHDPEHSAQHETHG